MTAENLGAPAKQFPFAEPALPNPTWIGRAVSTLDWLRCSTVPNARVAREFVNRNFALLPEFLRERFSRDLFQRWEATFFELLIARFLQVAGADLEPNRPTPDGHWLDFIANFEDERVVVEATCIDARPELSRERETNERLFRFFEGEAPPGWNVLLYHLPRLGGNDSKRELKSAIRQSAPQEAPNHEKDQREVRRMLRGGLLEFCWIPSGEDARQSVIAGGPFYTWSGSSKARIGATIRHKRPQVRAETLPVILAIGVRDWPWGFRDFDESLFGISVGVVRGNPPRQVSSESRATGHFARRSEKPPTYAAVLAVLNPDFVYRSEPVLYLHPRFTGSLPRALRDLEVRSLSKKGIVTEPAKRTRWSQVGFVVAE